ncbi:MAG: UPF0182 family protein [Anaerolineae bacterium]|nr:UPF0182 family protein [Anaerolineae bacterium]MCX8066787.1 UPF0182 family protein [Anaerolineae bacterium]MDW7990925.1 UPF0182 family protein [Anaerolineae bacterium]
MSGARVGWIIGALGALAVLGLVLVSLSAAFYTDWLWFEDLGYLSVYQTRLAAQALTFLLGYLTAFFFFWANWLFIPGRLLGGTQVLRPFRRTVQASLRTLRIILILTALFIAYVMAQILVANWVDLLVFLHAVPFGKADPIFGLDVGFYVFRLPVYRLLAGWFLALGILGLLGALAVYGTAGTLRDRGPVAHLSVLGAVTLGLIAAQYQLARLGLLTSARGVVFGAGYTDVHARIPLYNLLTAVVLIAAVLALVNLFLRRWRLLTLAMALWLGLALLGGLYPAAVQRFVVAPNELAAERPYIAHAIAFTRYAFGLENIREREFPARGVLTPEVLEANQATVQNIRLWDWRPLLTTYGQLQEIRLYYTFNDVDIDRYIIGGQLRQVMLAVRELDTEQLPEQAQTWINRHLIYTHGYGVVVSPVNEFTPEGLPRLLVRDIPPEAADPVLEVTRPEIYFGEVTKDYAIVNTTEPEFDYPSGDQNVYTRYEGPAGVPLGGFFRRLIFAVRFGHSQILFSTALRPDSRILFHRAIDDRVQMLAPFLWYDPDPYPVIADGRIVWLWDAYTWSDRFPYSEPFSGVNYIRNSVKVAIDAYTGETTFYVVDPTDPIIQVYQSIFPGLFTPGDRMPQALRDHWRYPERLFHIQAAAYAAYHMEDPQVFYNKEDLWAAPTEIGLQGEEEMAPYYVVMQVPGEDQVEFLLIRPYVPNGRRNMIAWLYADSDGEDYGLLEVFKFPKQELIYGPMQIEARFDQDPYISQQLTLWNQRGSQVIRGNLMVVPVDDTLLYVEPLYLQAETGRFPELKRVLVAYGDKVAMGESLEGALLQILGVTEAPPPAEETGPVTPGEEVPTDVAALVQAAKAHYDAAQECLRRADWACYGREQEALGRILTALVEATRE